MQLSVRGVHVNIGDALTTQIRERVELFNDKCGIEPIEVDVRITKDGYQFRTDIACHIQKGIVVRCNGLSQNAYTSVEGALDHLMARVIRHKKRLQTLNKHHGQRREKAMAPYYVINPEAPIAEGQQAVKEDGAPPTIAELEKEIPVMTVGDAVAQLDLSQEPAMMFRNTSHGELNMVYRRSDGNIGWVDPKIINTVEE
ncbi:MAG: ribosome hibernation-promoting factor, HPF/YfiA family [Alphaproteobacteria bacterium]